MRKWSISVFVLGALLLPFAAGAFTITFDEIPAGTDPSYYNTEENGVFIGSIFSIVDNSTSSWGLPHSGKNVLSLNMNYVYDYNPSLLFGYATTEFEKPLSVQRVGAYFSTSPGVIVKVLAYGNSSISPVASVVIGSLNESWDNRHIELYSAPGNINSVKFKAISIPDGARSFYMDDLTITTVPEPSSLAALALGLLPLAGCALRKRIK